MKTISMIVMFTLLAGCAEVYVAPKLAQPISKEEFREMMINVGELNYWSKAPSALMMTCGKEFPETRATSQNSYLTWQRANAEFNSRVDSTLAQYSPGVAKLMGKSQDEFQMLLTTAIYEAVAQRFTKEFVDADRQKLCANFDILLDSMMSEDLAKPHVSLAIERLQKYRKYVVD